MEQASEVSLAASETNVIKKHGLTEAKTVSTPIDLSVKLGWH